jgi:hypothetical protein
MQADPLSINRPILKRKEEKMKLNQNLSNQWTNRSLYVLSVLALAMLLVAPGAFASGEEKGTALKAITLKDYMQVPFSTVRAFINLRSAENNMKDGKPQAAETNLNDARKLLGAIARMFDSGEEHAFSEAQKSLEEAVKMLKSGDRDAARSEIEKARSALKDKLGTDKTGSFWEDMCQTLGSMENMDIHENFHQFFERIKSMADRSDRT